MQGATLRCVREITFTENFNPRAPCRARHAQIREMGSILPFQSTRPVQGATKRSSIRPKCWPFQSTRPVQGATNSIRIYCDGTSISIHAPRAGRDRAYCRRFQGSVDFNPRAPCRARPPRSPVLTRRAYFNPRAPCRARQRRLRFYRADSKISIHAPRAGRDSKKHEELLRQLNFNPRAPCRARRKPRHLPRLLRNFNPRAPCRARPWTPGICCDPPEFQSTRPVQGATQKKAMCSDYKPFQSTRPVQGATAGQCVRLGERRISIHAPRAGRDPNASKIIDALR